MAFDALPNAHPAELGALARAIAPAISARKSSNTVAAGESTATLPSQDSRRSSASSTSGPATGVASTAPRISRHGTDSTSRWRAMVLATSQSSRSPRAP